LSVQDIDIGHFPKSRYPAKHALPSLRSSLLCLELAEIGAWFIHAAHALAEDEEKGDKGEADQKSWYEGGHKTGDG